MRCWFLLQEPLCVLSAGKPLRPLLPSADGQQPELGGKRKKARVVKSQDRPPAEGAGPDQPAAGALQETEPAAAAAVDVRAWEGYGLGPRVLRALAGMGFEQPTPIQAECLLPAIRDRRDIIGAAQTVCTRSTLRLVRMGSCARTCMYGVYRRHACCWGLAFCCQTLHTRHT